MEEGRSQNANRCFCESHISWLYRIRLVAVPMCVVGRMERQMLEHYHNRRPTDNHHHHGRHERQLTRARSSISSHRRWRHLWCERATRRSLTARRGGDVDRTTTEWPRTGSKPVEMSCRRRRHDINRAKSVTGRAAVLSFRPGAAR